MCPTCGGDKLAALGDGKSTVEYEYIPGQFIRREHVQQVLACHCGEGIVTAPPPPRVFERCQYGAGFIAHLITAKCADALPLHRLEKQLKWTG